MSNQQTLELAHIQQASERIKDTVRRTPCLRTRFIRSPAVEDASLSLKLECLQVSGSFKARGANNKVLTLPAHARELGLVTASGGNHGLGVAYDLNGQHEAAQAAYRDGLDIAPDSMLLRNNYGLSLALAGEHEEGHVFIHELAEKLQENDKLFAYDKAVSMYIEKRKDSGWLYEPRVGVYKRQ